MYTILGELLSIAPFYFPDQLILIVRATGLIGISLTFFASPITKKYGVYRTFRTSLIISSVALLLMGISSNPIPLTVFSILFVAGIALLVPINIMLINQHAGDQKGTAVLFNAFILFIGASVGPLLASYLMKIGNAQFALTIFSILVFFGYLLSLLVKNKK
ncbi:MFS transporter [Ureibacillus sp. MALMAid1270]|uniref:MFS transporter n=1 Tax=Ureibacillus sp. MALMAid1270 TaxID=3411629 RepID=UPI003BA55D5F